MKILIANDTRIEENIGCHATFNNLKYFVERHVNNPTISTLLLGTDADYIKKGKLFEKEQKSLIHRILNRLGIKLNHSKRKKRSNFNFPKWEEIKNDLISEITKEKILNCDLFIINMEGSIHHNSIYGISLLTMADFAKRNQKYVCMVNGSYQAMDEHLSKAVLSKIPFISVREPISRNLLAKLGIKAHVIPDFAFNALIFEDKLSTDYNPSKGINSCLYTPGVLAAYNRQYGGFGIKTIQSHIECIRSAGYNPHFLLVEERERKFTDFLNKNSVPILDITSEKSVQIIGHLMAKFDLVITGRYHIGIFAIMSETKVFFLESNTHKIEGLIKLFGKLKEHYVFNKLNSRKLRRSVENYNYLEIDKLEIEDKLKIFADFLKKVDK